MLPLSLQTNVTSLFAQQQLETNDNNESNTIEQLTSGYRINSAGDDAAGLAVANELQANVTELQQGVINAANGTSTLQIIDGGLSNISNLLDRLQTLATESASGTFEGSRVTLNNEFQSVLTEITRQAGNVGLAQIDTCRRTAPIVAIHLLPSLLPGVLLCRSPQSALRPVLQSVRAKGCPW